MREIETEKEREVGKWTGGIERERERELETVSHTVHHFSQLSWVNFTPMKYLMPILPFLCLFPSP